MIGAINTTIGAFSNNDFHKENDSLCWKILSPVIKKTPTESIEAKITPIMQITKLNAKFNHLSLTPKLTLFSFGFFINE